MKNFVRQVLAVCVAMMLFVTFGAGLLAVVAAAAGGGGPEVKPKSLLRLDLSMPIVDKPVAGDIGETVRELAKGNEPPEGIPLRDVLNAINHAADDDRIAALYLTGNAAGGGLRSGWATFEEVRRALIAFKAKGKKIYAYNENYSERDYYLASTADKLYINKFGFIELNGFAADMLFFRNALDKYGVNVQVTRVGKYKSAVEPYLLDKMSDANREQLQMLLGDLMTAFLNGVSEARGIPVDAINQMAQEKGLLISGDAVERKLFDAAVDYDEILAELRTVTGTKVGEKIENLVDLDEYHANIADKLKKSGDKIAVIYAEGSIVDGESKKNVGGRTVARLLRKAREDKDIKAVVLRVNSPGGSAQASELILREVRLTKKEKPLVVSMGSLAASGGYWISTYADEIWAEPNTITGSIGVFGMFLNFEGLMREHGVTTDVVATHDMAALGSAYRPLTERELGVMQGTVDFVYEGFLDRVSEGRNLPREQVAEIAQGRVWSGAKAKELGLVDQLGGLQAAIAAAAQRAELKEDGYQIEQFQKERTPMETLMEKMGMNTQVRTRGQAENGLNRLMVEAEDMLESYNDPRGVYARMPYQLNID